MQYTFTNICGRMGNSKELTEFELGTVIGFHEMSSLPKYSMINFVTLLQSGSI